MAYTSNEDHPSGGGNHGCDVHRMHGIKYDPEICTLCTGKERSILGYVCPCDCSKANSYKHRDPACDPWRPDIDCSCSTCPPCQVCHPPQKAITKAEAKTAVRYKSFNINDLPQWLK